MRQWKSCHVIQIQLLHCHWDFRSGILIFVFFDVRSGIMLNVHAKIDFVAAQKPAMEKPEHNGEWNGWKMYISHECAPCAPHTHTHTHTVWHFKACMRLFLTLFSISQEMVSFFCAFFFCLLSGPICSLFLLTGAPPTTRFILLFVSNRFNRNHNTQQTMTCFAEKWAEQKEKKKKKLNKWTV